MRLKDKKLWGSKYESISPSNRFDLGNLANRSKKSGKDDNVDFNSMIRNSQKEPKVNINLYFFTVLNYFMNSKSENKMLIGEKPTDLYLIVKLIDFTKIYINKTENVCLRILQLPFHSLYRSLPTWSYKRKKWEIF